MRLSPMAMMLAAAFWIAGGTDLRADPGGAALEFLDKVARGEVNLEAGADTAISEFAGAAKRREIAGRLQRMALDVEGGELEIAEVRRDGSLAGVIVHRTRGYDPSKAAALAVAVVETGGRWLAAPVAASFENTGVALDLESRRRAAALERWMLRQRAIAHDVLRDQRRERMRRDINARISQDELRTMTVAEAADAFLTACRDGDTLRLLGLAGGLRDPLPDDWARRLDVIESATRDAELAPPAWRLMTSPEVLRARVHEESGALDGLFTIGCLDPAGGARGRVPPVRLVHVDMERADSGEWTLNLPSIFFDEFLDEPAVEGEDAFDVDLLDHFVERVREAHPADPGSSAADVWERLREATLADGPGPMLRLAEVPIDDPAAGRDVLGSVVRMWWRLRGAAGGRAIVPLAIEERDGRALALAQLFTFREPERADIQAFQLARDESGGWLWTPIAGPAAAGDDDATLADWRRQQERHWRARWRQEMMKPVASITRLEADLPVAGDAAIEVVRGFLEAAARGDLAECLRRCAVLDDDEGRGRLLRNLGYEMSAVREGPAAGFQAHTRSHWAAVTCRLPGDVNSGMPLFPVVTTPDGPRLLLEVDLFVGTRQRQFLNNVALERLENHADKPLRDELAALIAEMNRAPEEQDD